MIIRRLITLTIITPSLIGFNSFARPFMNSNAKAVVEHLQSTLVEVMKEADELGYNGRYQKLEATIQESHAFERIAKVAAGRFWDQFTSSQQSEFIRKFGQFSIANYASMFNGFSGEHFKVLVEETQRAGRKLVRTVLIKSDGEEIKLDYILAQGSHGWQIINIKTNGISDLALKRAEFTSVIEKEGFDGLLERLDQKIAELSSLQNSSLSHSPPDQ